MLKKMLKIGFQFIELWAIKKGIPIYICAFVCQLLANLLYIIGYILSEPSFRKIVFTSVALLYLRDLDIFQDNNFGCTTFDKFIDDTFLVDCIRTTA